MKFIKIFSLLGVLSLIGYISFNITYEKVSAIVMQEAEEEEKNKIKIHPIIKEDKIEEDEIEEDETGEDNDSEVLNVITNNFIFIGDDRLNISVNNYNKELGSVEYILSKDANYKWLKNEGVDQLDTLLNTKGGHYNIIINPGIKDLDRIGDYIELFNDLSYKYSDQNIFVLNIAPLDELEYIKNNIDIVNIEDSDTEFEFTNNYIDILNDINLVNNDDIYKFNIDIMKNTSDNIHVIHIFQELMENGYSTIDGYYLDEDTSNLLLKIIANHIKSLQTQTIK